MLDPGQVERRPPALLVVAGEAEVVRQARHAAGDEADSGPSVEPAPQVDDGRNRLAPPEQYEAERGAEERAMLLGTALNTW